MQQTVADFNIVIKPSKSWFGLDLAEIWPYRVLLFLLVRRDFLSNYKQNDPRSVLVHHSTIHYNNHIHCDFSKDGPNSY